MHNYKKLIVWHKALELNKAIYELTKLLPGTEQYGIISQLNRASVSVPSNISEGAAKKSDNEFEHYLGIAAGSCNEIQTQLEICVNLNYLQQEQINSASSQVEEIQKILRTLRKKFTKNKTKDFYRNNPDDLPGV